MRHNEKMRKDSMKMFAVFTVKHGNRNSFLNNGIITESNKIAIIRDKEFKIR